MNPIKPNIEQHIDKILQSQRDFFATGKTLSKDFRMEQLNTLKTAIINYEPLIIHALKQDLNKSATESYLGEISLVLNEIDILQKNLDKLIKPVDVATTVGQFPAKSQIIYEPYGVVLNIAPWNYPFQLCLLPIVGAISAGNTVILKPSEFAIHTTKVIVDMISEYFNPDFFAVIEGDWQVNQTLLQRKFDYIFFTGSVAVGKIVMKSASEHLTPITLELGGKSPCIIDKTADISQSAKRIIWGKTFNAGQTCIAPDYLLVDETIKDDLIKEMQISLNELYGENPLNSPDYPKIISQKHYERLKGFLNNGNIVIGGKFNDNTQQISPTVLTDIDWQMPIMQEEIFGAILPVLTYKHIDEAIQQIKSQAKPLALYLFTKDNQIEQKVLNNISFGGGCVNDTLMHITNHHLPFGGVGDSGMGNYHGQFSFYTFSHAKSILKRGTWLDIPLRYPPYDDKKLAMIKKVL